MKTDGQKRIVGYYVSQKAIKQGYRSCPIKTLNAHHLDELVRALSLDYLHQHEAFTVLHRHEAQVRDHWLRQIIDWVHVAPDRLTLELDAAQIEACKTCEELKPQADQEIDGSIPTCLYQPELEQRGKLVVLTLAIQIKRLDGKRMLLSPEGHDLCMPAQPEPKPHLVTAIAQAYHWKQLLEEAGESIESVAERLPVTERRVRRLLPLTLLGPDIVKRVLTGELPPSLTLDDLLYAAQHLNWQRQAQHLGLDQFSAQRLHA